MPGSRITFGAAAIPEPEKDWLAAAERMPVDSLDSRSGEAMQVLRTLWRGGPVSHHGAFFHLMTWS